MKLKYRKKIIIGILITVIAASTFLLTRNRNLSPEETVELYFQYYANKDTEGMNTLIRDEEKFEQKHLKDVEYVHLLSCYEEPNDKRINDVVIKQLYPEAQYVAVVYVVCEIKVFSEAPDIKFYWLFHLAKKEENDPWIIAGYGY